MLLCFIGRYNTTMCGLNEDFGDDTLFSIVPRRGGDAIGRDGVEALHTQ